MSQFLKLLDKPVGSVCNLALKEGVLIRGVERSLNDHGGVINIVKDSQFKVADRVKQHGNATLVELCPKNPCDISFTEDGTGNRVCYESIYVTMTNRQVERVTFHGEKPEPRYGFPGYKDYLPALIDNIEVTI